MLALAQAAVADEAARPMFARRVGMQPNSANPSGSGIPTNWDFKWKYNGNSYSAVFIGTDPSKGSATTTIPVEIIPVVMKYNGKEENPLTVKVKGGKTVIANTDTSPIFTKSIDYKQGGVDLGKTQYEDAFQRAALWGVGVSKDTSYHVLFSKPKVEKKLVINATGEEVNPFGTSEVFLLDINTFDNAIQSTVAKLPANSLPMFVTVNTYLTSGGCCIGGYHNYNGTQAYGMYTYITDVGSFAQDVSALSHEIGEWLDDPLTNNSVACGIYEVGDPLEGGQPGHPYGTWTYKGHGFTYHLQDLVLPPYFGAPPTTSVNKYFTFQGYTGLGVCSNGG
jgi:hypothetical protein